MLALTSAAVPSIAATHWPPTLPPSVQSKTVAPTASQWVDGLAAAIQQIALSAAKVVVLGDTVAAAGASFTDTARWECTSSRVPRWWAILSFP